MIIKNCFDVTVNLFVYGVAVLLYFQAWGSITRMCRKKPRGNPLW